MSKHESSGSANSGEREQVPSELGRIGPSEVSVIMNI